MSGSCSGWSPHPLCVLLHPHIPCRAGVGSPPPEFVHHDQGRAEEVPSHHRCGGGVVGPRLSSLRGQSWASQAVRGRRRRRRRRCHRHRRLRRLAAPSPPLYGRLRALRSSALGWAAARVGTELRARKGGAGSGGWVGMGLPRWRARVPGREASVHARERALTRARCVRRARGRGRFGRVDPRDGPTSPTMGEVYSIGASGALSRAWVVRFILSCGHSEVENRPATAVSSP